MYRGIIKEQGMAQDLRYNEKKHLLSHSCNLAKYHSDL